MARSIKEDAARSPDGLARSSCRAGTHPMFAVPSSLHSADAGSLAVRSCSNTYESSAGWAVRRWYNSPEATGQQDVESRSKAHESGHSDEAGKRQSAHIGGPVHSTQEGQVQDSLNSSLLDEMVSVRRRIDDLRQRQEAHDRSLRELVQREFQALKIEVLDNGEGIRNFLDLRDTRLEELLKKVSVMQLESSVKDIVVDIDDQTIIHQTAPFPSEVREAKEAQAKKAGLRHSEENSVPSAVVPNSEGGSKPEPTGDLRPISEWSSFQHFVEDTDYDCMYGEVLGRKLKARSFWHNIFRRLGYAHCIYLEMPDTALARMTEHSIFVAFQTLLILSNTGIMGYETDLAIKGVLSEPKKTLPGWLSTCDLVYNIIFAMELVFRIVALRSWFWVAPAEWGWNLFDFILVVFSLVSDLLTGVNLSFMRTLRILRAVRVARIIRVLRFFRQLRSMLFAILSCLGSLAWAFVFLAMIMFMFAILFLQGAVQFIEDMASDEGLEMRGQTQLWWGSLGRAMLSMLASVTGGADWLDVRQPINEAGPLYGAAFIVYLLFVTVGVMNVLTGVFLSSADEFVDLSLIAANEELRVDQFCEQMMELFGEIDFYHNGDVDWATFREALKRENVRAYLASLQMEPTHIRLLFELLDEEGRGKINITQFVMGMVRLKGEAKAIDARIIERAVSMLPPTMSSLFHHHCPVPPAVSESTLQSQSRQEVLQSSSSPTSP